MHAICEVDRDILVAVRGVFAWRPSSAQEEIVEDSQRIGDVNVSVDVEVTPAELDLAEVLVGVFRSIAAILGAGGLPAERGQQQRGRRGQAS
jgi:hypothetical protein